MSKTYVNWHIDLEATTAQNVPMHNSPTPLKDLTILKNIAITHMPIAVVAKNHGVSTQVALAKARRTAQMICCLLDIEGPDDTSRRLRLSVPEIDMIQDYNASHEALQKG